MLRTAPRRPVSCKFCVFDGDDGDGGGGDGGGEGDGGGDGGGDSGGESVLDNKDRPAHDTAVHFVRSMEGA